MKVGLSDDGLYLFPGSSVFSLFLMIHFDLKITKCTCQWENMFYFTKEFISF